MEKGQLGRQSYGRYTAFLFDKEGRSFDESDRKRMRDFWQNTGVPNACEAEGWRGLSIVESLETAGRLRTLTSWESKEAFDRYYTGDAHKDVVTAIREMGFRIDDRDGLEVLIDARAKGGVLRIIGSRVKPDRINDVAAYWRSTGGPLIRRQPGCLQADAYWGTEPGLFVLVIEWRSMTDCERFMASKEHQEFGAGLGDAVIEISSRQTLERIV